MRTPLEAIQEFQVLTSMYDAEFGRASGAVVNAVTKAGTNQFKGVVFGYAASNALTAKDFFVKQQQPDQADDDEARVGRRARRADRQEQGALLRQPRAAGRQPEPDARLRTRPDSTSRSPRTASTGTRWSASTTRSRESTPGRSAGCARTRRSGTPIGNRQTLESYQDETDLDQTAVGTLTSVLGNSRVNTVRVAQDLGALVARQRVLPRAGSDRRPDGFKFGEEASGNQALCPPQLDHLQLAHRPGQHRIAGSVGLELPDRGRLLVVHPRQEGRPRVKFGARYNYTELERVSQINENGTFRSTRDLPFDAANPRTYPERLTIRMGDVQRVHQEPHLSSCSRRTSGRSAAARR